MRTAAAKTSSTTTSWIDCPRCGTSPATTPVRAPRGATRPFARCGCGRELPVRVITVRWTIGVPVPRECPPECLNGRSDCTCRCGGRCHGAGFCSCRSLAAWTPPARVAATAQGLLF